MNKRKNNSVGYGEIKIYIIDHCFEMPFDRSNSSKIYLLVNNQWLLRSRPIKNRQIIKIYLFWPPCGNFFEILINAIDFSGKITRRREVSGISMNAFLMLKVASSFQAAANHSSGHQRPLFMAILTGQLKSDHLNRWLRMSSDVFECLKIEIE